MLRKDFHARARVRALIETIALAAAVTAGVLAWPVGARATPAVGQVAPDFALKGVDGRNLRLSEYRGDVVVLTFWTGRCGPCRATLSGLNALAAGVPGEAPTVLGVFIESDTARAASVASSLDLAYPTLVDAQQSVARLYDVDRVPLTLLVDREGVVRGAWSAVEPPSVELAGRIAGLAP
jgi:peroxiredoxin